MLAMIDWLMAAIGELSVRFPNLDLWCITFAIPIGGVVAGMYYRFIAEVALGAAADLHKIAERDDDDR